MVMFNGRQYRRILNIQILHQGRELLQKWGVSNYVYVVLYLMGRIEQHITHTEYQREAKAKV
jgi:hypothetical protein